MMVTLRAVRREDGMLDYSKDGPGPFNSVLPPEKLDGQLQANCALQEEIRKFIDDLETQGVAVLSFSERRTTLYT
jgi:hypothetical protein